MPSIESRNVSDGDKAAPQAGFDAVAQRAAAICGADAVEWHDSQQTVAPADVLQAAELLRFCNERNLPVNPTGAGTKQDWLEPARTPTLRLRTTRMNALREHTWQDMTCTVGAGCTWAALQAALAVHGQCVALDPLWPEQATVGGVVSTNDSGSLRLRYGGLRDLLIGVTAVLSDGTVARSGGKVVKNVAGYDLPKLFCGAFGTLALITEVSFRLHAVARDTVTLTLRAPAAGTLCAILLRVLDSHLSTQSMQLRTDESGSFVLDVRLAALPEVLTAQTERLAQLACEEGASADPLDEAAARRAWAARETLFASASGDTVLLKASVLPTGIARLAEVLAGTGARVVAQAHGLVTASLPAAAAEMLHHERERLQAAGGSLVILRRPEKFALSRFGPAPAALAVMDAVKQRLDPHAILNPGRFLGLPLSGPPHA